MMTEPEITRGFYNIASTLHHFHSMSRRFHLNITPENILLLPNGQWKLCGFGLSLSLQNGELVVPIPYFLPTMATSSLAAVALNLEPNDSYLCPEIVSTPSQSSSIQYATPESDIFSLGVVLYEIYNHLLFSQKRGISFRPLLESHHPPHNSQHRDIVNALPKHSVLETIRQHADNLPVADEIRSLLLLMLDPNPSTRTNLSNLLNHSVFLSSPLSLYLQMDHLPQLISTVSYQLQSKSSKSDILAISLFTSFPSALSHLRPFVLHSQVLPLLVTATRQNPFLWEYSLPILVSISSQVPLSLFLEHTSSLFISGFSSSSGELILLLLQNMNFFLDLFSRSYFNQYIVLLFYSAINFHSLPSLQSIAISILSDEKILESIEVAYYRKTLIPLVCHVVCQQSDQTVKLHGVIFLKFILPSLDQEYIQTYLLPTFRHLLTYPSSPPSSSATSSHSPQPPASLDPVLLVTLLPVYKQISQLVTVDLVCQEILLVLLPLLVDRSLSHDHYRYVMEQIQSYLALISRARETDYSAPKESERVCQEVKIIPPWQPPTPPGDSLPTSQGEGNSSLHPTRQPYRDKALLPLPGAQRQSGDELKTSNGSGTEIGTGEMSSPSNLSVLREEIQRTQAEILRLQTELTSAAAPTPSPPPACSPFPPTMLLAPGYDAPVGYHQAAYWNPPPSQGNGYGMGQPPPPFPFPHYSQPLHHGAMPPPMHQSTSGYPLGTPLSSYPQPPMPCDPQPYPTHSPPLPGSSQSMNPFDS